MIKNDFSKKRQTYEQGSSLMGLAFLTLAIGFFITGGLYLLKIYNVVHDDQTSIDYTRDVQFAMDDFAAREGRLPCPAPLDARIDDPADTFGKEDCTAGSGIFSVNGRDPDDDSTTGVNGPLPPLTVLIGAVPVRTLNIADKKMLDGYHKRQVYAVTENLTLNTADVNHDLGAISIRTELGDSISDVDGHVTYAIIGSGEDGRGAYDTQGTLLDPCQAGTDAGENCDFLGAAPGTANATFIASSQKSFNNGANSFTHSIAFKANLVPYKWYTGPWDSCGFNRATGVDEGICFSSTQARTVECRDHRNNQVPDAKCTIHTPRPIDNRPCALGPCTWGWSATCSP